MKKLHLSTTEYQKLEQGFREWLTALNYSKSTIYNLPGQLREFLYYLEKKAIKKIQHLTAKDIQAYYKKLSQRKNQRRGGGLSKAHLNKHQQTIRKFLEYLHKVHQTSISICLKAEKEDNKKKVILTPREIEALLKSTEKYPSTIGLRDRAMIAVYYGCGLRRSEGVNLVVDDIDLRNKLLLVKGKGYKERLIPMSRKVMEHVRNYLSYGRTPLLCNNAKEEAFFISYRGRPMDGIALYKRLKELQQTSENKALKTKTIGLHTLRHSIATHLLKRGMSLEKIKDFLGHSSIDVTQGYVQITEEDHE